MEAMILSEAQQDWFDEDDRLPVLHMGAGLLEMSVAGKWQRLGAESEKAERISVQGVSVTASRPLDLLNVLQDHVV